MHADPLAEIRRAAAYVDRDVIDLAGTDAHQLALGLLQLIVQAAQHAARGARMVVLYEFAGYPGGFGKAPCVETLVEEAAFVTEYLGF